MPSLKRVYEAILGEYLGEEAHATEGFHTLKTVIPVLFESAREVAVLLGFPRRTAIVQHDDSELLTTIDSDVIRVLGATYDGLEVPEASLTEVLRFAEYPQSPFPRAYCVGYFTGAQHLQLRWGPPTGDGGTWILDVVYDNAPRFESVGEDYFTLSPPDYPTSDLADATFLAELDEKLLWDGLHGQWWMVVVWRTLMKLHLKERNEERAGAYQQLYRQALREFGESIGVRPLGFVEEAK